VNHETKKCEEVPHSSQYHYKNHSAEFECPECHRKARFNLNFLGRRKVFCDGQKFTKVRVWTT
jgi:hypothetical protein